MYVLIDRERMIVLHKSHDVFALCDVAWIECQSVPYSVLPIDSALHLKEFTDMELKLLYKQITGETECAITSRSVLLQVIYDLCHRINETEIVATEASAQAQKVPEDTSLKYKYVKGSLTPARTPDLFELPGKAAPRNEADERQALAGKLPALTGPTITSPPSPKPVTSNPTPQAKAPGQPKRGKTKPVIWETADRVWADAGKPSDKGSVLNLRKEIMTELESVGIKRTTASSELGNWQKARLPQ